MNSIYGLVLLISATLLFCIAFSRYLTRFGVPVLIFFLLAGMFMGSEGPGGIYFDDAASASNIGHYAICFILFAGGLATNWKTARSVLAPGSMLATVCVLITAVLTACAAHFITGLSWSGGMFLGAVVSCTDAASVFSILKSNHINLKKPIAPLLEFESSSNDPASYLLTIMVVNYIAASSSGVGGFIITFAQQFILGGLLGYLFGRVGSYIIDKMKNSSEGLYPVIIATVAAMAYSAIQLCHGNGFLGVYITGLVIGNLKMAHRERMVRFFDGISWFMQIWVFVTLGLLVFPHQLTEVWVGGLLVSLLLMLVIRPIAVFISLSPFNYPLKAKAFISWVGLRGASAIVFATYALTKHLPQADLIFNTVFFISLTSVVIQGSLLPKAAVWFDQLEKEDKKALVSKTFTDYEEEEMGDGLFELFVNDRCKASNKTLSELKFPDGIRAIMIKRNDKNITPTGKTIIHTGDKLVITSNNSQALLDLKSRLLFD